MTAVGAAARGPRYYHGWNIVGACIIAQLAALGVTLNCFSLFLPGWTAEFHTPASALALGVTIFSFGCAIFAVPAGLAVDRFPIRWVMGLGLAGIALFHLVVGFAGSGLQIILAYSVLLAVAVTFSSGIPSQGVVARWFVRRRGAAMGLCAFGLAMAGVIFPPIITWLLPLVGWRATWWLFGGLIGLVLLPIVVVMLRDRPTAEEGADYMTRAAEAPQATQITVREVFARPNFWAIVVVFLAVQFISSMASINMAPVAFSRGVSLQTAGLLLSVFSVAALVGKLSSGLLADYMGNRIPFAVVAALAAGGVVALAFAHSLPMFVVVMVLIGLSQGHWTLLASATAEEFGAGAFGRVYGVICAFSPIGSIAPPIVAWVFERSGDYVAPLLVLAAVSLAGGAVALIGLRERRDAAAVVAA